VAPLAISVAYWAVPLAGLRVMLLGVLGCGQPVVHVRPLGPAPPKAQPVELEPLAWLLMRRYPPALAVPHHDLQQTDDPMTLQKEEVPALVGAWVVLEAELVAVPVWIEQSLVRVQEYRLVVARVLRSLSLLMPQVKFQELQPLPVLAWQHEVPQ